MRFLHSAFALAAAALLLSLSTSAHANTIDGSVYCNLSSADASNTPVPGSALSSGTLCATFQASSINFTNNSTNTVGFFLNSGNAIIGTVNYVNGFTASSNLDDSLFTFTGTAYFANGQTYSATHDDGTVMNVNGVTVINKPAPTSPITDSFVFTGVSGNYSFAYNFTEVQGGTTYESDAANSPVPEPSSLLLFGSGLVGFAGAARRRLTSR